MRKYRSLYKSYTGERLEQEIKKLDDKILSKRHPRRLIGVFRRRKHWAEVFLKRVASRYLPSVYKMLRRKRDEKAASGG
jgi:hypothetical protein